MVVGLVVAGLIAFSPADLFPEGGMSDGDLALQEEVERLLASPLDLNRATSDQLLTIPWLDPFLAYTIVRLRDSLGRFERIDQLAEVPGMSQAGLAALLTVAGLGAHRTPSYGSVVVRVRTDSLSKESRGWAMATCVSAQRGHWSLRGIAEKDRGEPSLVDFVGGGIQYHRGALRVAAGDYAIGVGRGLVLAGGPRRSGARAGDELRSEPSLTLVATPEEETGLRGAAATVRVGRYDFSGFSILARRDARLNADGSVAALRPAGIHDDSGAEAERDRVAESGAGAAIAGRWHRLSVSLHGAYSRYSRCFAPADTSRAFSGQSLLDVGGAADLLVGDYFLGVEAAVASTGGLAGALELAGEWPAASVGMNLRGHTRRYFAPHGRWTSLASRRDRVDLSGRFAYRVGLLSIGCRGNTYREYETDSLPARAELTADQRIGPLVLNLAAGRSLRAAAEQFRTARFGFELDWPRRVRFHLSVADEYPEGRAARGRSVAAGVQSSWRAIDAAILGVRFDITGAGVSMSMPEPGAMRIGARFSTGRSAWRTCTGIAVRPWRGARVGFKAGWTWMESGSYPDVALQLETELR